MWIAAGPSGRSTLNSAALPMRNCQDCRLLAIVVLVLQLVLVLVIVIQLATTMEVCKLRAVQIYSRK